MIAIDEEIKTKEVLFTDLYKEAFPVVANFVNKNGGTFEDARDVFQEALIIYYEKYLIVDQPDSHNGYLIGIARHLWYKRFRVSKMYESLDLSAFEQSETTRDIHPSEEKLLKFLEYAGQRCLEVLRAFYYDKLSMAKLSEKFGFSGERSATVQKYKCLEKVREQIKEKEKDYEDFAE